MEFLASQPEFEAAPVAPIEAEVIYGEKKTSHLIMLENSFKSGETPASINA